MFLKIHPRQAWEAQEPKKTMIPDIITPVLFVFFSYVLKDYASRRYIIPGPRPDHWQTCQELQYIQRGDLKKLPDIRFNDSFMIGVDGAVYEGRGWDKRPTIPRKYSHLSWNSLYVGFIGDFREADPTEEAFDSKEEFLRAGVKGKVINPRFLEFFLGYREYRNDSLMSYR